MKSGGKVTFVGERAISITVTEVQTQTQTFPLEHPAINATGYALRMSTVIVSTQVHIAGNRTSNF